MKHIAITLLVLIVLGCSKDDNVEDQLQTEPFVGSWSLQGVSRDYSDPLEDWQPATLVIMQEDEKGGIYQMLDTTYDSIWSTSGTWMINAVENQFFIDDLIDVWYSFEDNTMMLEKFVASTSIPCDLEEEGGCVLGINGYWQFSFERISSP